MKHTIAIACLAFTSVTCFQSYGGPPPETDKKIIEQPKEDHWELRLSMPGWIAMSQGDTGINGTTSHSIIGFNEIVNKIDMTASFRAELSRGRFGILGDFSYFSISDGVGAHGLLKKVDVREDQALVDLGLRWRLLEGPKGWLDFIGGTRYTYLYESIGLHSDDQQIGRTANALAVAGTLLRARLAGTLTSVNGSDQHFAVAPLAAQEPEKLARDIERIKGRTVDRANGIKKLLHKDLNQRITRTDDWYDPYFGLRGRYNITEKFYLLGRADISPFDIGSDFAWQTSAGFGLQLSPRLYSEVVYRILAVDYRHDGLIYNDTSHGPEVTLGFIF